MDIQSIEKRLSRLELKKSMWIEESDNHKKDFERDISKYSDIKKSSALLQHCSTQLRSTMASSVEETVTWAIRLILKEDYTFKMDFVQRRNQWECDFKLIDPNGKEVDIKNGTGGGIIDVVSLSLYILFYTLFANHSRLPVILDEPLKHVSTEVSEYADRTITFLRGICERLGIQIVMVTHQEPLVAAADKAYRMEMSGNKTFVTDVTIPRPVYSE